MGSRPSPSDQTAAILRANPPVLDDLARTRMERGVVTAGLAGGAPARSEPRPRWRRRGPAVALAGAATVAAAAALWWVGPGGAPGPDGPSASISEATVPSSLEAEGMPAQGETLRTGAGQRVRARIGASEVELEANSRAQFERISPEELRVRLRQGAVRVKFHPTNPSQRMAVITPAARVEVVGTVFRVEVDGANATGVWVEEGQVQVVPTTEGQEAHSVSSGDSTRVELPGTVAVDVVDALVEDDGEGTGRVPLRRTARPTRRSAKTRRPRRRTKHRPRPHPLLHGKGQGRARAGRCGATSTSRGSPSRPSFPRHGTSSTGSATTPPGGGCWPSPTRRPTRARSAHGRGS
jgi:ferric-dicitrate binding protein FerR (iron transport regulator)